ncbi:MAG: hypothetical protein SGJ11_17730 [Phycisphaerae bacterium]|nr:hypothetical protein [Phycisphaerae bacterium]
MNPIVVSGAFVSLPFCTSSATTSVPGVPLSCDNPPVVIGKDTVLAVTDTNFDTVLSVFNGCIGTQLGCNDDAPNPGCQLDGLNRKSRVNISGFAGQVFFIRVSGFNGSTGNFALRINADCIG